jgi:transcriptional regulator with PAS, ATPase and Fis domain
MHSWVKEFPFPVTVCNEKGIIVEMNDASVKAFHDDGGERLIGSNLFECHPEPARTKLEELLRTPRNNIYTIEKNGIKKIICQSPLYTEGNFSGIVEISIVVPPDTPNFIRR